MANGQRWGVSPEASPWKSRPYVWRWAVHTPLPFLHESWAISDLTGFMGVFEIKQWGISIQNSGIGSWIIAPKLFFLAIISHEDRMPLKSTLWSWWQIPMGSLRRREWLGSLSSLTSSDASSGPKSIKILLWSKSKGGEVNFFFFLHIWHPILLKNR